MAVRKDRWGRGFSGPKKVSRGVMTWLGGESVYRDGDRDYEDDVAALEKAFSFYCHGLFG